MKIGTRGRFTGTPYAFERVENPIRRAFGQFWVLRPFRLTIGEAERYPVVVTNWRGSSFGAFHIGFAKKQLLELTTEDNRVSYWGFVTDFIPNE